VTKSNSTKLRRSTAPKRTERALTDGPMTATPADPPQVSGAAPIYLPPPTMDASGLFELFEPYPTAVDIAELLEEISALIRRHVITSKEEADAMALWIVSTHVHDVCEFSPILAILSPEMRCGKTTLLKVIAALVPRAISSANISPASVFRIADKYCPTLLIDEADTFLDSHDDLRGILNCGHTRTSACVIRCHHDNRDPVTFNTWCPKVIAMIGELPPTLLDRSIPVRLKRKLPTEQIESFGSRSKEEAHVLRSKVARWARDNMEKLRD